MRYDPMSFFIHVVNQFGNMKIEKLSIHAFDSCWPTQDGKNSKDVFCEEKEKLINVLPNIFNADVPGFDDAERWALDWVNAYDNSFLFFDVLSELFDYDSTKARQKFIGFINSHMSPIIENKTGKVCSLGKNMNLHDENNVTYWTLLFDMYKYIFIDSSQTCCSYQICQSQGNSQDICYETPLFNLYNNRTKCLFHQIYLMWGLKKCTVHKGFDYSLPFNQ